MTNRQARMYIYAAWAGALVFGSLVIMLGAGQPAAKVCVGVAAIEDKDGRIVVVRAFSDGSVAQRGPHSLNWEGLR